MAVIVETKDLLYTVIASLIAGIGITAVFSIAIWGAARFVDFSLDERRLAAAAVALVGLLALLVTLAAVAFGLVVMTSK
ncbi:MAG TPA: hypothetical protein VFZ41_07680 [Solirubrobacterales bacterium]